MVSILANFIDKNAKIGYLNTFLMFSTQVIYYDMQHSSTNINENIETKIIEQTSDSITIEFTNKQPVDWIYSEYYSIEVFDQGVWCIVPFTENISVIDIAYILEPNKTATHTYPLNHHTLYTGQYRIIVDSSATEFNIK